MTLGAPVAETAERRRTALRLAAFVLVFLVLHAAYTRWPAAEAFVIEHLTVGAAAALVGWWDPGLGARAQGAQLLATGGGLRVLEGCEGTDVALLLVSAMLTAPLALVWRLAGVAAALGVVWLLNQARVIALFYAWRHEPVLFDALHALVLPLAMLLAAGLFFLAWTSRFARAGSQRA